VFAVTTLVPFVTAVITTTSLIVTMRTIIIVATMIREMALALRLAPKDLE
jgi:hypothetical protein